MRTVRLVRPVLVAFSLLAMLAVAAPPPATAHPLGNFTVNRAVIVEIGAAQIEVRYLVDMAEIPAFTELQRIDADDDGAVADAESETWARDACSSAGAGLRLSADGAALGLTELSQPQLSFPAGAGGLDTLRLSCAFVAPFEAVDGQRAVEVRDTVDDERIGWREVTIVAGAGIEIVGSDVPQVSPSRELTAYPEDQLQSPPDVRGGSATVRATGAGAILAGSEPDSATASADLRPADPLAALISGAPLSLGLLGPLIAGLLGAAHAVSPGHGKTLVAAYVIGSRGTLRHAAVLGLTVAATHTAGVFVLGAVLLLGGELVVPERLVTWLSIAAATLVVALGVGMLWRAVADERSSRAHAGSHHHDAHDAHAGGHAHPHDHSHGDDQAEVGSRSTRLRSVITLGLAGGMVPSASAVIVLLVALSTNQVAYGLVLIIAFGVGMAVVLGGLALTTGWLRGRIAQRASAGKSRALHAIGRAVPFVAASSVLVAGVGTGIGALIQVL